MSQRRPKMSEEKRRRLIKKKKQKKFISSLIGTILAIGVLVGAMYLTTNLVSGDKQGISTSSQTTPEEVNSHQAQASSKETQEESMENQESEAEVLTPEETVSKEKPEPGDFGRLVDVNNPLPSDFAPEVSEVGSTGKLFDSRAVEDLERMLSDAAAAGYSMYLVSTYRTIEYQEGLYNRKVNEYINLGYEEEAAKSEAAKWVAIPGTSEHNLGLAADIVSSTWYDYNSDLTQEFENTEHFQWLYENSADYGFFISFQKGKESITGIVYEPWHYRYVGVELATYLTENNLSLQEYYQE